MVLFKDFDKEGKKLSDYNAEARVELEKSAVNPNHKFPLNSTKLMMAIKADDHELTQEILDSIKSRSNISELINKKNEHGLSVLNYAVVYGDGALVRQLIDLGANINTTNVDNVHLIQYLYDSRMKPVDSETIDLIVPQVDTVVHRFVNNVLGNDYVINAASAGAWGVVFNMLDKGWKDNKSIAGNNLLDIASFITDLDERHRVQNILINKYHKNPLDSQEYMLSRVEEGDIESVKSFIEQGWDVNGWSSKKNSPLNTAIISNQVAMAKLLVDNGADPNVKTQSEDWYSAYSAHDLVTGCADDIAVNLIKSPLDRSEYLKIFKSYDSDNKKTFINSAIGSFKHIFDSVSAGVSNDNNHKPGQH